MQNDFELKWKRPASLDYPKIWHTFKAKDINGDQFVEYQIEDLPESRIQEAIAFTVKYYCTEEPLWQAYSIIPQFINIYVLFRISVRITSKSISTGLFAIDEAVDSFVQMCKIMAKQKMTVACFKNGSNEIIGLNWNFVISKNDRNLNSALYNVSQRHLIIQIIVRSLSGTYLLSPI